MDHQRVKCERCQEEGWKLVASAFSWGDLGRIRGGARIIFLGGGGLTITRVITRHKK